ncbi:hypothetical protein GCM10008969_06210 [Pseudomonas veronii subsp. inensis]
MHGLVIVRARRLIQRSRQLTGGRRFGEDRRHCGDTGSRPRIEGQDTISLKRTSPKTLSTKGGSPGLPAMVMTLVRVLGR